MPRGSTGTRASAASTHSRRYVSWSSTPSVALAVSRTRHTTSVTALSATPVAVGREHRLAAPVPQPDVDPAAQQQRVDPHQAGAPHGPPVAAEQAEHRGPPGPAPGQPAEPEQPQRPQRPRTPPTARGQSPAPAYAGSPSASAPSGGTSPAHQEVTAQPAAPQAPAATPAAPGSTRAGRSVSSGSTLGAGRGRAATGAPRPGLLPRALPTADDRGPQRHRRRMGGRRGTAGWTGISVVASLWMSRAGRWPASAAPSGASGPGGAGGLVSGFVEEVVLMRAPASAPDAS